MKISTDRIHKTCTCKNCTRTRTRTRCRSQPLYFHNLEYVYELNEVKVILQKLHFILHIMKISTDRIQKWVRVRMVHVHVLVHVADLNIFYIADTA